MEKNFIHKLWRANSKKYSTAVVVPKKIIDELGWTVGDNVAIKKEGNGIVVKKVEESVV